jgi:hypothetical protein
LLPAAEELEEILLVGINDSLAAGRLGYGRGCFIGEVHGQSRSHHAGFDSMTTFGLNWSEMQDVIACTPLVEKRKYRWGGGGHLSHDAEGLRTG